MSKIKESYKKLVNGDSPAFAIWALFIGGLLILVLSPIILTRPAIHDWFVFSDKGEIGDTIGGTTVPFISLVGAFLTFMAFWTQVRSNKKQTAQFDKQDKDNRRERFENKFFELIKIHRENVNEFNIEDKVHGKKSFIHMFNELKFCYYLFSKHYKLEFKDGKVKQKLSESEIFNIAYLTFFFGVGETSDKAFEDLMNKYDTKLIEYYHKLIEGWQTAYGKNKQIKIPDTNDGIYQMPLKYKPFNGHSSRLGHYYRHLFQTAKFVIEQSEDVITDKYEYIKTLRAQLTTHEQLLLYYNSLSVLGQPWHEKELLTEYRMIKNIPLPYADFSIKPKEKLGETNKKGESLFEWDEILDRQKRL